MKRILIAGALLLLPGIAMAGPSWTGTQIGADPQEAPTLRHDYTYAFNCSTGGAGSLLVGAVAAGLLVRRRK